MKRRFVWFSTVLLLGAVLAAALLVARTLAERAQDAKAAVEAVMTAQQEAWNRGDIPAFLEGYWRSPELTFSGSNGLTKGWESVLARYQSTYADREAMGKLQFSGLEFRPLGPDAALLLGKWQLERKGGDIGGVFSLVWQRFPEGWRIVHDHTSAVARK